MRKLLAWYITLALIVGGTVRYFPIFPAYRPLWILQLITSELGILFFLLLLVLLIVLRRDRNLMVAGAVALVITSIPVLEMLSHERDWIWDLNYSMREHQKSDAALSNPYSQYSNDALFHFADFFQLPERAAPKTEFISARDQAVLPILIYQPDVANTLNTPAKPWILSVHGGGWDSGSPDQLDSHYVDLLRAGYTIIAPTYRFAPSFRWPRQLEDIQDAYQWVLKNADRLGLDPDHYWLMGRSAGGQIALKFAYQKDLKTPPRGVIALYSPTDIEFGYNWSFEQDILNSRRLLQAYTGTTPDVNVEMYRDASPLNDVRKGVPRTLMITGRADPLVWYRHSQRLRDALRSNGVGTVLIEFPWGTHGFDYFPNSPGGQITRNSILRFLETTKN